MECHAKLRGRIREKYKTQENFAKALGISRGSLIGRLKGDLDFTYAEVINGCRLLGLNDEDAPEYFFNPEFGFPNYRKGIITSPATKGILTHE